MSGLVQAVESIIVATKIMYQIHHGVIHSVKQLDYNEQHHKILVLVLHQLDNQCIKLRYQEFYSE